jgi:hypothetical protein
MGPYSYALVHDERLRNSLTVLGREIILEYPRPGKVLSSIYLSGDANLRIFSSNRSRSSNKNLRI